MLAVDLYREVFARPQFLSGAPERIRTSGLRIRSPALYPAELRAQNSMSNNIR